MSHYSLESRGINTTDAGARVVCILGAGSWGTAIAALLADGGHQIRLWCRNAELAAAIQLERENRRYLPGTLLPPSVSSTSSLSDALCGADCCVFAVPSGAIRGAAADAAPYLREDMLIISASKGLEESTGLRMSQVLAAAAPINPSRLVTLSGPNLAVEVAAGAPTASVAAAEDAQAARAVQGLFGRQAVPTFRVYTGRDVIGVELGGAIKNVIAIGAGLCDGLSYGDNSKAALMTRGLTETIRLGIAQGAQAQTFLGLAGVGDLIATGASKLSRNYRVGYALGQGGALETILASLGHVAEGVPTTRVLHDLALSCGVDMPLCAALRALLFENRRPQDVIRELMQRPPKEEILPL